MAEYEEVEDITDEPSEDVESGGDDSDAQEAEQAEMFLREQGVPLPKSEKPEEETTDKPPKAKRPKREVKTPEEGFKLREEARQLHTLQNENASLRGYLQAMMDTLRQPAQVAPEPEEPEPDFFADPKEALERRVKPLQEKIENLEGKLQQREEFNGFVGTLERAEKEFTQQHADYPEAVQALQTMLYEDLMDYKVPPEVLPQAMQQALMSMISAALRAGMNPVEHLYTRGQRALRLRGAGTQPAPGATPTAAAQVGSRMEAAQRAIEAGVTTSVGDGETGDGEAMGDDIASIESALQRGLSPKAFASQVRQMLRKPGGQQRYMELMRRLEGGRPSQ